MITSEVFSRREKVKPYMHLSGSELMDRMIIALNQNQPLSVISVGYTESFVMAQYTIFSEDEFMKDPEALVANANAKTERGHFHRGLTFPNIVARDQAVEAVKKADIIGMNINVTNSGSLAERVFTHYHIEPKYVYEAYVRRVIMYSQKEKFYQMLKNRKILIICNYAEVVKAGLERDLKEELGFEIVGTIKIQQFADIPRVKQEIDNYEFDLCLIAAGINAVILASYIAETKGKVAFDIGQGMESLISIHDQFIPGEDWLDEQVSLKRLMEM